MPNVSTVNSCLEVLPDEVWLIMLAHLSPTDRLYSFGNMNTRLNAILREAGAGIDDELVSNSSLFHELSPCISFVKLQRRCVTIDLYYLIHIRSLTILQMLQYQIAAIDPIYLPHLTHLHLSSISSALDADFDRLLESILNQQFQSLVSMHLPRASFFGHFKYVGHSGLQNVTIGSCRSNRFSNLIGLIPNVRFLEIQHLINWPIRQTVTHSKLFSLKLHIDTANSDTQDIDRLKMALPSLQHMKTIELKIKESKCIPLSVFDTKL